MEKIMSLITNNFLYVLILIFVLYLIIWIVVIAVKKTKIKNLSNNSLELSPKEFLNLRKSTLKGRGKYSSKIADDYVGVYIIYNETKNMYYVGQAKKVMQRVNAHFTGHGNGDVYADYKFGDKFTIKTIAFNTSGYNSLDKLEKDTIEAYSAFSRGYNKTRGNS
ncbi:MAG: GIY-YIG nuclease family protein [Erysipelotrichaceae bacterium]|nr:GIY-YIG nuclease family protein [Erysipelotrichaceae bacterium]